MKKKIIRKKKNPEIKKYKMEYIRLEDIISDFTKNEKKEIIDLLEPDLKRALYTLGAGYDPDVPQGFNKCLPVIIRTSELLSTMYEYYELDRYSNPTFEKMRDAIDDSNCDYIDVNLKDVDWYGSWN